MMNAAGTLQCHALEARVTLIALGGIQFVNGVWATLAPRSFYDDFPLGIGGWVSALPAYNEHLMRDVGGLFLATGFILLAAAVRLEARVVALALISYLLFSIPHAIFHYFNLEPYGTGDVIGNVVALAATVVLPLGILFLMRRDAAAAPGPSASAAPGGTAARIAGVPDNSANPVVRAAYRESRRRSGEVLEPLRIFAHHPKVLAGYGAHEMAAERSDRVPRRIKHLAELRAAMLPGCEWCCDFGSSISSASGVSEEDMRELPLYPQSTRFSDLEKLVLDYATGMSRTPVDVSDELFARLREHFDEAQLVELTDVIALENYRARFNWAFGIESQGFSEGAYCVRPEAAAATPSPRPGP
jgi:alkylhydroperoxidase family enzyme